MLLSMRALLIRTGRALPFVLCAIVAISYSEALYALLTEDFLYHDGVLVLNKPVSWFLGGLCEYNLQHLVILTIISIAVETCIWNKLTLVYLAVNLFEKWWFSFAEYEITIYTVVCVANIAVSLWLCRKGVKMLK